MQNSAGRETAEGMWPLAKSSKYTKSKQKGGPVMPAEGLWPLAKGSKYAKSKQNRGTGYRRQNASRRHAATGEGRQKGAKGNSFIEGKNPLCLATYLGNKNKTRKSRKQYYRNENIVNRK